MHASRIIDARQRTEIRCTPTFLLLSTICSALTRQECYSSLFKWRVPKQLRAFRFFANLDEWFYTRYLLFRSTYRSYNCFWLLMYLSRFIYEDSSEFES